MNLVAREINEEIGFITMVYLQGTINLDEFFQWGIENYPDIRHYAWRDINGFGTIII